jgi:hypothetical protein
VIFGKKSSAVLAAAAAAYARLPVGTSPPYAATLPSQAVS